MPKPKFVAEHRFVLPQVSAGMPNTTPILLALSGGADSRALLHLLSDAAEREGFAITVAHVNHGIRGDEAQRDEDFCRALAEAYGVELVCLRADVPRLAKESGRGLEETAREVRYRFFAEQMSQKSIPLLVTAHHADDQLETVLFRLGRGSGARGLGGMATCRPFASGHLVRPLLEVTRREILAFCEENRLDYVTDSTNADATYARNYIRSELIPRMERVFDAPQLHAAHTAQALREDEECLTELSLALLSQARQEDGLSIDALRDTHGAILKRSLGGYVESKTGHFPERVHLEALAALVNGTTPNAEVALTGGFCAYSERGLLRIGREIETPTEELCLPISDGTQVLSGFGVEICVKKLDSNTKIHNLSTESHIILNIGSAIMKKDLYWRTRRNGDRLLRGGMHRELKGLLAEAELPPSRRRTLPLLCDREGILWIPFVGARDGADAEGDAYRISVRLLADRPHR